VDFELRVTRSRKPGALLTGGRMTGNEGMRVLVGVGGGGDPVRVPSCNYTLSFALTLRKSVRLVRKLPDTVPFIDLVTALTGDCGGSVIKVLCYKSEARWFDPSWCQWIFH